MREKRMHGRTQCAKNLIKRWARVRKEQWGQLSRCAILCPYCDKKYSIVTHLIIHLGIRENPYNWPTCTCPIKPGNTGIHEIWGSVRGNAKQEKQNLIWAAKNKAGQAMREKIKRRLGGDALLNVQAPAERIKLIPKAGHAKAKRRKQNRKIINEPRRSSRYFQNYNSKKIKTEKRPGTPVPRITSQEPI